MRHGPHSRHRRLGRCLAIAALLVVGTTACGGDAEPDTKAAAHVHGSHDRSKGVTLDRGFPKPDLVLTDTEGKRFDFREETAGRPTLVFFGYTHCPDVCPLTMSNIAVAKKRLPAAEQDKLRVVFITSDPARDTPRPLGSWLRAQDPDFIGLTGDFATIQAGARTLGVSLEPAVEKKNGDIVSSHSTQVFAFSPTDDTAHVLYTEDVPVETYLRDLPRLVKGKMP